MNPMNAIAMAERRIEQTEGTLEKPWMLKVGSSPTRLMLPIICLALWRRVEGIDKLEIDLALRN